MSPKRTFAVMIYCRQGIAIYPLFVSQRVSSKKKGRAGSHSSPARKVCRKDGEFLRGIFPWQQQIETTWRPASKIDREIFNLRYKTLFTKSVRIVYAIYWIVHINPI